MTPVSAGQNEKGRLDMRNEDREEFFVLAEGKLHLVITAAGTKNYKNSELLRWAGEQLMSNDAKKIILDYFLCRS